ncbi:peptidylprolyl isomerase [Sphingomonas sp.]|uniref:peptidylprolyl isomerase n=1 Tax=Sphingomonas sp. TaxID=28214 RepID=UPI00286DCFB5|nr:peptidylprolyl isomerase [Sphingomonas sp.]
MSRALFALPFLSLALVAAKDPPPAPAPPAPLTIIAPPAIAADPANRLTLELSTGGKVVIQLRPDAAPAHVERIRTLVGQGFYTGTPFHRVIPGFMAQGGDPTGKGDGDSPLPDLKAEFNALPHLRGTVAAARTEAPDSANSQFYIMYAPRISLDHKYTVFGRVIEGMAAVDAIAVGEPPAEPTRIVRATIGDTPPPMPVAATAQPASAAPAAEPAPGAPAPAASEPAPAVPEPATPAPEPSPAAPSGG